MKFFIGILMMVWNHRVTAYAEARQAEPGSFGLSSLIIFGDEQSDDGNLFRLTKGEQPRNPEFYRGRFSDGPVWGEYLRNLTGVTSYVNLAVGGATATTLESDTTTKSGSTSGSNFLTQINRFDKWVTRQPNFNSSNAQVIIALGKNDATIDPSSSFKKTVLSLQKGVEVLINKFGLTKILIAGSMEPNSNKIPLETMTLRLSERMNKKYSKLDSDIRMWPIANRYIDELVFRGNGILNPTLESVYGPKWRDEMSKCLMDIVPDEINLKAHPECHDITNKLLINKRYMRTTMHKIIAKSAFREMHLKRRNNLGLLGDVFNFFQPN